MNSTQIEFKNWVRELTMQNPDLARTCRIEYLNNRKWEIYKEVARWLTDLAKYNLLQYADISKEQTELSKINKEIYRYEHPKYMEGITDEMIQTAREYPITDLIEVNQRGFAVCPFHDDHNPSAFCKNNYLYCFACNTQADTIKLYMHLNNCDFKTAVKELN